MNKDEAILLLANTLIDVMEFNMSALDIQNMTGMPMEHCEKTSEMLNKLYLGATYGVFMASEDVVEALS